MKDSEYPYWLSISKYRKEYEEGGLLEIVSIGPGKGLAQIRAESMVCTAGRMILYFKDKIPEVYKKGGRINMWTI